MNRRIRMWKAFCRIVVLAFLSSGYAAQATTFDVADDFSATNNPNGVWSYGWSSTLTSAFNLYPNHCKIDDIDHWAGSNCPYSPNVSHNGTENPNTNHPTIIWQPGQFALHPGDNGEYSHALWTAPYAGTFDIDAMFTGIDHGGTSPFLGTTTDVHVLHNGISLFDGEVIGYGDTSSFSTTVSVGMGDIIDFTVGYGSNQNHTCDTTALSATIIPVLTVVSPNGGENLVAGNTYNITWETVGDANIPNVNIEYSDSNGLSWDIVDSNTTNDGQYDWLLPEITSNQCLVRVSDVNDANIYDTSDDVFTIFRCLHPTGDLNKDCFVDFFDFAMMAANWIKSGNIDDGLVAYWSFDEGSGTIAHDSADDNDGNLVGPPTWVDGISGKALDFDGSGDYVGLPSSSNLSFNSPSEPFSTSFWIKPDTVIPIEQTILENEDDYVVYVNGGVLAYRKSDSGNLYHNSWFSTNPEISAGIWSHVAITYDGTGAGGTKMYVNGEEKPVTNTTYHGGGSASGNNFAIGIMTFDFATHPYGGEIDEVRIYNRALSEAEIQYLYENP